MPRRTAQIARSRTPKPAPRPASAHSVDAILTALRKLGKSRFCDDMINRYGITGSTAETAFGVPVGKLRELAKRLKAAGDSQQNHALAGALWQTGQYEARMLAAFVDEPQLVTPAQMDRWRRDFDNWAICDTVCFHLFDRTPHALAKVEKWAEDKGEFQKRAAFALLASAALHRRPRNAQQDAFARCLLLVERAAADERNFVKKAVSWALRAIAGRTPELQIAALWMAERLAASPSGAARWVGRDVLRQVKKPTGASAATPRRRAGAKQ